MSDLLSEGVILAIDSANSMASTHRALVRPWR